MLGSIARRYNPAANLWTSADKALGLQVEHGSNGAKGGMQLEANTP